MLAFKRQGHDVFSLSQSTGAGIHDFVRQYGVETFSHVLGSSTGLWYYLRHSLYFINFCRRYKIDVVYSQLEGPSFVSVLSQYFVKARIFVCRHHSSEARLRGYDRALFYKFTYKFARKVIVVSEKARRFMIEEERIPESKIIHIDLGYDFGNYDRPDKKNVEAIRSSLHSELILVSAGRLTVQKRVDLSLLTLQSLRRQGIQAALVILGRGEEASMLYDKARAMELSDYVLMPGWVSNTLDYLAASDFLLHPSLSESSCVTVKEAALVNLPVIVCKGVGDFDEYLEHGINAFVTDPERFVKQAVDVVKEFASDKEGRMRIAENLKRKVLEKFSIANILPEYSKLNGE